MPAVAICLSLFNEPVAHYRSVFTRWQNLWILRFLFRLTLCVVGGAAHALSAERPNVLLIISDDLAACQGCYGNGVCRTPHIDRLAQQGVRFDRAYCQFPVCGASRASLMSGLYPNRTQVLKNIPPRWTDRTDIGNYRVANEKLQDHPSLATFFRNQGYFTARVSKIFHMGIPGEIEKGITIADDPASWDYAYNVLAPETMSGGEYELLSPKMEHVGSCFSRIILPDHLESTQVDVLATNQAISILETRSKNDVQPFFLGVGLVRPHVPLVAPQRLFALYPESKITLPFVPADTKSQVPASALVCANDVRYGMNDQQKKQAIAAYYAAVTFMDEQVGRLMETLDRLKLRENTIVVFMSDHGYNLGEHDCWQKISLFEESVRIPLIISPPHSQDSGRVVTEVVQGIDLYPTLAELAGLHAQLPELLQGKSLVGLMRGEKSDKLERFAYTITLNQGESIRTRDWRYSVWGGGEEELYDHRMDHHENVNLAGRPEFARQLQLLRDQLKSAREASF